MNKKLLAAAIAGAFALPSMALAQSNVTLSGVLKMSVESMRMGGRATNSSETRVKDDASRIVIRVTEDLGGGLSAIGHVDTRIHLDTGAGGLAAGLANGPAYVGLKSKAWGEIGIGRYDLHYHHSSSDVAARGALSASDVTILAGHATAVGGYGTIVGSSRWRNVVRYDAPRMGGIFDVIVAYSSNILADDADIAVGNTARKGSAWHIAPYLTGQNWRLLYSYAKNKPDGAGAINERGDRLMGFYRFAGLEVGLAWDRIKKNTLAGVEVNNRTAWSLPVTYRTGPHTIAAHYAKARDDKIATGGLATTGQTGAKMFAASYQYALSKRTSMAFTYAKITNEAGAAYRLYADHAYGGAGETPLAGEDPRIFSFTLMHTY